MCSLRGFSTCGATNINPTISTAQNSETGASKLGETSSTLTQPILRVVVILKTVLHLETGDNVMKNE
jgi:hypothetical protein